MSPRRMTRAEWDAMSLVTWSVVFVVLVIGGLVARAFS